MTQEEALTILKTGANVFLTGEPGSGKTHTINQYISYLRSFGIEPSITASTGIAATHIGGYTIHSWSGIGIKNNLTEYDLDQIGQNKNIVRRVSSAHVLIIDEISMLSSAILSMVDAVCREIRHNTETFGGLQVILVGDFFQLPPVNKKEHTEKQKTLIEDSEIPQFAFLSPVWKTLNLLPCYLSEQHRQEDEVFLEFLSALRRSSVKESHLKLLRARYSKNKKGDITELYSHNADVDKINNTELLKIESETKEFEMESKGPDKLVESLKRGCLSPEKLFLKIGARVMFTKNDPVTHRYANGTLGQIVGFLDSADSTAKDGYPIVKTSSGKIITAEPDEWRIEDGGRTLARITQVPLRLAWAMTVHKSQGMSLDQAHMDLSGAFEYGQGYVALSRVRTLSGLSLAGLNQKALEIHPDILEKDKEFREKSLKTKEIFTRISEKELETMHENFLKSCGGKIGGGKKTTTKMTTSTYQATKEVLSQKLSLKEIAEKREVTIGTIISHLEKLIAEKKIDRENDIGHMKPEKNRFNKIVKALEEVYKKENKALLSPAKEILGDDYDYEEIRLARLFLDFK